jgi:hypothetical protein
MWADSEIGLALSTGPQVLPEDGDRIQSPKRCVLKDKHEGVLDKDKTMDNVQKRHICKNKSPYRQVSETYLISYS